MFVLADLLILCLYLLVICDCTELWCLLLAYGFWFGGLACLLVDLCCFGFLLVWFALVCVVCVLLFAANLLFILLDLLLCF